MKSLNILDLFSGIGGMSLGFEAANYDDFDFNELPKDQKSKSDNFFKTIAFCEIDKNCHKVLNTHFKGVPIFDDVTKLKASDLKDSVDIITGGFPCQDLSFANAKRKGFDGARSSLFEHILRIANETQAKYILFENSDRLIYNREFFEIFTKRIKSYGFKYEAFIFQASDFGYPHQRRRLYIIAYTDKIRSIQTNPFFDKLAIKKPTNRTRRELGGLCSRISDLQKQGYKHARDCRDIRKDNGISERLVKLGMFGNSLIPAIPYAFAKVIKEIEK
nr:DNA (cytosine-5-)-methyltransferase [Campylobacter sp.]